MADDQTQNVVSLPVLRGGTIEDTLSGFAHQIDRDGPLGRRVERAVSILSVAIRGWDGVAAALGDETARRMLDETAARVVVVLRTVGAEEVVVAGDDDQPTV